jgi:transposase-like protein
MNADRATSQRTEAGPRCPFCGSAQVELLSLFGSQLLTDQYYCRACHTPFEHVKDYDAGGAGPLPRPPREAGGR